MTPSERALQYANDVLDGKIVTGKYVKLACQRFLDDLDRSLTDWPYRYDADKANRAVEFQEALPHVKDRWARRGECLLYQPWQCFIECNVFGWVSKETDLRRFRESYEEVARKNGKSTRMAARGLYLFCADGEFGAEVYSGATSERQAWEVFRPARQMVLRTEELKESFGIDVNAKSLVIMANGSRFEPLIGKPGDGASVSAYICDEFHEHPDADQYGTMKTGMISREQAIASIITTAGSNLSGPCYEKRADAVRVLERNVEDDTFFAIIFCADEGDEWDSDEALIKANPNLDISINRAALEANRNQARRSATDQNDFRTKHLNQWVGAATVWMNQVAWRRQRKEYVIDDFRGLPAWIGVDLASKKDLAAVAVLVPFESQFYTFFDFFAPEAALEENDKYRNLREWITFTPGAATDYAFIQECLEQRGKHFQVRDIAFDPWQAQFLMQRLLEKGLPVTEFPHQVRTMSDPMKEVEALVLDGRLWHYNPVMDWMVGNVVTRIDHKNNVYPGKERKDDHRCKTDGVVALIMAMGRYLHSREEGDIDGWLANPVAL
jgi:phage terminase large subunit-like protein